MSESNKSICSDCRHNIRKRDIHDRIICVCEVDDYYIGNDTERMSWCKNWAKEKEGEKK